MPPTIKARSTSRKARGSITPGKNKTRPGCQGSHIKKETAPRVIANSFFALTLKPKPGIEVLISYGKDSTLLRNEDNDYYKMYKDLLACMQHGMKVFKGEKTWTDPLASGMDIGASIAFVTNIFERELLPKGFAYNIDKTEKDEYYFTIYKECDFQSFWHAFEIGPLVKKLKKESKALHDLFIEFIQSFTNKCAISTWYNGGMGYAEFMMEEEIQNWDDNHGDGEEETAEKAKAVACFDDYNKGVAHKYEHLIKNCKFRNTDYLLKRLSRFDNKNPLVAWMKDACAFMDLPGNVNDFIYYEEDAEGLTFDRQVALIWDWDDHYTFMQQESLDAEANGTGILSPVLNFHFTPKNKKIDLQKFLSAERWPKELTKLFHAYNEMLEKYTKAK